MAGLPRKNTPTGSPANKFEIEHTGPHNFTVSGGGTKFDIDGFRGTIILDAKHVGNAARSPFVPGSKIPSFLRDKITGQQLDELRRVKNIPDDAGNPFTSLEIITNNAAAKGFFEGLMKQAGVTGRVVVR